MKINELKIVKAKDLNESLAKTFGTKLRLEDFTNEQTPQDTSENPSCPSSQDPQLIQRRKIIETTPSIH